MYRTSRLEDRKNCSTERKSSRSGKFNVNAYFDGVKVAQHSYQQNKSRWKFEKKKFIFNGFKMGAEKNGIYGMHCSSFGTNTLLKKAVVFFTVKKCFAKKNTIELDQWTMF